jgi:threonine synthase
MAYFLKKSKKDINILVATSGDTGSAVGHGFLGVEGIKVTILYPSGKVSNTQEKQLTTLGQNITALEIDGVFDDCQKLVKSAFLDKELSENLNLSSANSINIARLIPQSFYYFWTYAQLKKQGKPIVFCVPSGNFGNLCGGLIATKMGLPVERFIASTNVNDIVPHYLESGLFEPKSSIATISNAMDVGNPSNFPRMIALFDNDYDKVIKHVVGKAYTDEQTKVVMKSVYDQYGYVMCPHTAVGYLGLKEYLSESKVEVNGVVLGTAHPSKFDTVVDPILDITIDLPDHLKEINAREKVALSMSADFEVFKEFLLG